MKFIILSLTLSLLISCAKEQKTNAQVSVRLASSLNGEFAGSLILMGKNIQTQQTFFKEVGPNGITIDLENGNWSFATMGWEGDPTTAGNFTGKAYCDVKQNISLSGGVVDLNFSATVQKCGLNPFGGPSVADPTHGFKQFIINSCIDIKNSLSSFSDPDNSPEDKGCGMTADATPVPENGSDRYLDGTNQYFRISMYGRRLDGGISLPIRSRCLQKHELKSATSNIRLPFGSGAIPISYSIEAFHSDSSCSTQAPTKTYNFINGFYQRDINQETFVQNDANQNTDPDNDNLIQLEVFLHEDGCSNPSSDPLDPSDFSLSQHPDGSNTMNSKYLICNANQLALVGDSDIFPNSQKATYFLGKDLTINTETLIRPADVVGNPIPFEANFYGDNHTISSITDSLFDDIKAIDKSIEIRDLKIVSANINVDSPLAIAGIFSNKIKAESGSKLSIENVSIDDTSSISLSTSYPSDQVLTLGGFVGRSTNLSGSDKLIISNSHSNASIYTAKATDHAVAASIGGFIGESHNHSSISKSSFKGELNLHNMGASSAVHSAGFIGKVAGVTSDRQLLEKVSVNIKSLNPMGNLYSQKLGGIVGKLESLVELELTNVMLKTSNLNTSDFNITDGKFYALIANTPTPVDLHLTVDGFLADVNTISPQAFNTGSAGYLIPFIPAAAPNLSLGSNSPDGSKAKIAIIHNGLTDMTPIGLATERLKQYNFMSDIDSGFFVNSPDWIMTTEAGVIEINLNFNN